MTIHQTLESPATIASAVSRTGAHQVAELQFGRLNDRRDQIIAETRALVAANYGKMNGEEGVARGIRALEKERIEIEVKLRPLVLKVRDHRVERAARVAKELAPKKRIAAQRMLELAAELRACINVFDQCDVEFVRAGGGDGFASPLLTPQANGFVQYCESQARLALGIAE